MNPRLRPRPSGHLWGIAVGTAVAGGHNWDLKLEKPAFEDHDSRLKPWFWAELRPFSASGEGFVARANIVPHYPTLGRGSGTSETGVSPGRRWRKSTPAESFTLRRATQP